MMSIVLLGKTEPEDLGLVPEFLSENDPRPAKEQFDANYQHGGGWHTIKGFEVGQVKDTGSAGLMLKYPGDPALAPIAFWAFRDELVVMYPYGLVAIFQPGGSYEVSRLD